MMIPADFVDQVLGQADIGDLVGRRLTLKRRGREFVALCPFHNEKTPSFTVVPEKGFFHCFGCGAHGSAIGFLMDYENLPFPEAVKALAAELGMDVPGEQERAREQAPIYEALGRAAHYYAGQLEHDRRAQAYVRERGLTPETIAHYGIGYAPAGKDGLVRHLGERGVSEETLIAAGLARREEDGALEDFYRNRLMFPIRDATGRALSFGGRTLGASRAKYINGPETAVFRKRDGIYGLYEARQRRYRQDRLVVVEGYMDVVMLDQAGVAGAVAALGTSVTEAHVRRLYGAGAREIVFCFDGDAAGNGAAWRALERALPAATGERHLRFAFLPEGKDPDDFVREHGAEPFTALLDRGKVLSDFLVSGEPRDASPEERARWINRVKALVAQVKDPAYREALATLVAERAGVSRETMESARPTITAASANPAPEALGPRRLDPRVAYAFSLLIHWPAELAGEGDPDAIRARSEGVAGAEYLAQAMEAYRERPTTKVGELLERWRGHPAEPSLARLAMTELALWEPESKQGERRLKGEYRALIERIRRRDPHERLDELQRLLSERALTEDELAELRGLVRVATGQEEEHGPVEAVMSP